MHPQVYICGPFTGTVLAWQFFRLTNPSEVEESRPGSIRQKSVEFIMSRMSFPLSPDNPNGNTARLVSMLSMEFVGTFMIAWALALSGNAEGGDRAIAIGAAVTAMVYTGGAVSGGHYNPCITVGVKTIHL